MVFLSEKAFCLLQSVLHAYHLWLELLRSGHLNLCSIQREWKAKHSQLMSKFILLFELFIDLKSLKRLQLTKEVGPSPDMVQRCAANIFYSGTALAQWLMWAQFFCPPEIKRVVKGISWNVIGVIYFPWNVKRPILFSWNVKRRSFLVKREKHIFFVAKVGKGNELVQHWFAINPQNQSRQCLKMFKTEQGTVISFNDIWIELAYYAVPEKCGMTLAWLWFKAGLKINIKAILVFMDL